MKKNLRISILLDFYGSVLTKKQKDVIELYYNEDLSLAEISEHVKITRQGVRDSIKRGEKTLFDLEEKLGMEKNYSRLQTLVREIEREVNSISSENSKIISSDKINISLERIKKITKQLLNEEK